jgi:hypothetical protein
MKNNLLYYFVILFHFLLLVSSYNTPINVTEIPIGKNIDEYTACLINDNIYMLSLRKKKLALSEIVNNKVQSKKTLKKIEYRFSNLKNNFYQLENSILLKPDNDTQTDIVIHFNGLTIEKIMAPKYWNFNLRSCTFYENKIFFLMDSCKIKCELFEYKNGSLKKLLRYKKAEYEIGGINVYNIEDRILITVPSKIGEYFYAVEYPGDTMRVYEFTSKKGLLNKKYGTVISSPSTVYFTTYDSASQSLNIESFYSSRNQVLSKEKIKIDEFNLNLFSMNNKKYAVLKMQNTSSIYLLNNNISDNEVKDYFKYFNNKYEISEVLSANPINGKLYINLKNKETNDLVIGVIDF